MTSAGHQPVILVPRSGRDTKWYRRATSDTRARPARPGPSADLGPRHRQHSGRSLETRSESRSDANHEHLLAWPDVPHLTAEPDDLPGMAKKACQRNSRARRNTASSISWVSRPADVFCCHNQSFCIPRVARTSVSALTAQVEVLMSHRSIDARPSSMPPTRSATSWSMRSRHLLLVLGSVY